MSQVTTCPHCSTRINVPEGITVKTMICPHCLADVNNPQPGSQIRVPDLNTDVKRDLKVGGIILAVLFGFCVLGILVSIPSPRSKSDPWDVVAPYFCVFSLAALAVVLIIAGIRLVQRGRSGAAVLQIDKAVGCVLLVLGTIASFVIFIWFACAVLWKPHWGL